MKSHHVEIVQYECGFIDGQFVRDCLRIVLVFLEYDPDLVSLLPDENVVGHMEGRLDICDQKSVLLGRLVLHKHQGEVFGVALVVLLEDRVLCLPHLLCRELGQIPPVVEACQLLRRDLVILHDLVSETLELVFGESLIHADISSGLHLIEAKFSDFRNDLCLLL